MNDLRTKIDKKNLSELVKITYREKKIKGEEKN